MGARLVAANWYSADGRRLVGFNPAGRGGRDRPRRRAALGNDGRAVPGCAWSSPVTLATSSSLHVRNWLHSVCTSWALFSRPVEERYVGCACPAGCVRRARAQGDVEDVAVADRHGQADRSRRLAAATTPSSSGSSPLPRSSSRGARPALGVRARGVVLQQVRRGEPRRGPGRAEAGPPLLSRSGLGGIGEVERWERLRRALRCMRDDDDDPSSVTHPGAGSGASARRSSSCIRARSIRLLERELPDASPGSAAWFVVNVTNGSASSLKLSSSSWYAVEIHPVAQNLLVVVLAPAPRRCSARRGRASVRFAPGRCAGAPEGARR